MSTIVAATTLALPKPPTQLVATPISTAEIGLTWSAGPSGMPIAAYYIFRGTSPSNLTQVATRTTTAFTDYPLTPGTTYYYAVEEADKGGNVSPMSAVVPATTLALP
jgi:chitodextrinase